MKKIKIILFFVFILVIVSLLTYLNYDKILNYFTNKEWQIADSVGKIELTNYIDVCGTNSNFMVFRNNNVEGYSDVSKKTFDKDLNIKDVVTYSCADYCIVADKDLGSVYVILEDKVVWNTTISNANVLATYINKNGYAAVIYSQTGYKSLIKVFSNNGEELFTNYLASTYAIDVAISNDNKTLAIAEVDASGINVVSRIKLVDIKEASENNIKKYNLDNDELITDIEFGENNDLIFLSDMNVGLLDNDEIKYMINLEEENILFADITNKKNIVTIKNEKTGLFDSNVQVCIYDYHLLNEPHIYEIEDVPNDIRCLKNIIAVDMGDKIIFLNNSGNFVKKCEYHGQLKDIQLFNNGNTAVLIFRDTAEFVKIGGI